MLNRREIIPSLIGGFLSLFGVRSEPGLVKIEPIKLEPRKFELTLDSGKLREQISELVETKIKVAIENINRIKFAGVLVEFDRDNYYVNGIQTDYLWADVENGGFPSNSRSSRENIDVFLNGEKLSACVAANSVEGWARVYRQIFENGQLSCFENLATEKLYGSVRIINKDSST